MSNDVFRRIMKPYSQRGEDGYLILEFADSWNGTPCFAQFPAHIQRATLSEPHIKSGIHLEALLSAGHIGGDVFKAVRDDIDCLIATRIMVERFPMDPLTKSAALAFPDFNGGAPSPLDEIMVEATMEPLPDRDDEEEITL